MLHAGQTLSFPPSPPSFLVSLDGWRIWSPNSCEDLCRKRSDIRGIIKQKKKKKNSLKKKNEIRLGKLQAHTERGVYIYIYKYSWGPKERECRFSNGSSLLVLCKMREKEVVLGMLQATIKKKEKYIFQPFSFLLLFFLMFFSFSSPMGALPYAGTLCAPGARGKSGEVLSKISFSCCHCPWGVGFYREKQAQTKV